MGGTGVATANSANATYFNPALLAQHNQRKELNGEQRLVSPSAAGRATELTLDLADIQAADYETRFTDSIDAFNAAREAGSPEQDAAQAVVDTALDIDDVLDRVSEDTLALDAQLGFAVGIPALHEGGAFFVQSRVAGGGIANITPEDRELLNDYIEGMTYVASGGTEGVEHPELFGINDLLLDRTDELTSTTVARAAFIVESGVSLGFAREFRGQAFMWGITPKVQALSSYDHLETVTEGQIKVQTDTRYRMDLNLDVGLAAPLAGGYQVGLIAKNLFKRDITTQFGNNIAITPQLRGGISKREGRWLLAADLDLLENPRYGLEPENQEIAAGAEYSVNTHVNLRGGYLHNLREFDQMGLVTLGLGLAGWGLEFDLALGISDSERSAALQFAARF